MGFQDEMKQMFLRIAAGEIEPEEWEKWWNSNKVKLEEIRGSSYFAQPPFYTNFFDTRYTVF